MHDNDVEMQNPKNCDSPISSFSLLVSLGDLAPTLEADTVGDTVGCTAGGSGVACAAGLIGSSSCLESVLDQSSEVDWATTNVNTNSNATAAWNVPEYKKILEKNDMLVKNKRYQSRLHSKRNIYQKHCRLS